MAELRGTYSASKGIMKTNIETKVENIGPATAKAYLEVAAPNRKLNQRAVARYTHAMKSGGWRLTHQGIAFDENGKMIDGQHRPTAIIASGKTVQMNVSRYSANAPMAVLDSGASRTVSDRVQISGIIGKHTREVVATLNAMLLAETGNSSRETLQPHEIESLYGQESGAIDFVFTAFGAKHSTQWNSIVRAGFAYCSAFAPIETAQLATMIREKVGYKKGTAAHAFVVALTEGKLQSRSHSERADTMAKVLWLIRQHIEGKNVERTRATASVFNWAARQRQAKNRLLAPLLK